MGNRPTPEQLEAAKQRASSLVIVDSDKGLPTEIALELFNAAVVLRHEVEALQAERDTI